MIGYNSPLNSRYYDEQMNIAWSTSSHYRTIVRIWMNNHNKFMEMNGMPGLKIESPLDSLNNEEMDELVAKVAAREKETGHELVALLQVVQELMEGENNRLYNAHHLLHTGLTSSDVQDQSVLLKTIWSLTRIMKRVRDIVRYLSRRADAGNLDVYLVGRTHLQPAEPTTLLHRLTILAQELMDWLASADLTLMQLLSYTGLLSGSVGTYENTKAAMIGLGFDRELVPNDERAKSQTLPRSLDLAVAQALDRLASILHKQAFDYRLESGFGQVYDRAAKDRVGSSAMPYKKNPIRAEKINSLTRHIHSLCATAWDNASWQGLERTLDDSANRRMWLPESFLTMAHVVTQFDSLLVDYIRIEETDPESWRSVWEQSRVQSAKEATAYGTKHQAGFDFDGDLKISIEQDKRIMAKIAEFLPSITKTADSVDSFGFQKTMNSRFGGIE